MNDSEGLHVTPVACARAPARGGNSLFARTLSFFCFFLCGRAPHCREAPRARAMHSTQRSQAMPCSHGRGCSRRGAARAASNLLRRLVGRPLLERARRGHQPAVRALRAVCSRVPGRAARRVAGGHGAARGARTGTFSATVAEVSNRIGSETTWQKFTRIQPAAAACGKMMSERGEETSPSHRKV